MLIRLLQRRYVSTAVGAALGLLATMAFAQEMLRVDDAWVGATVPGQPVAAGYMTLSTQAPLRLLRIETPAAKVTQIHSMTNDGGIMRMRELGTLDLPEGRLVKLQPGGVHLMLSGLNAPLREGQRVRLTLTVQDRVGKQSQHSVDAPVRRTPIK